MNGGLAIGCAFNINRRLVDIIGQKPGEIDSSFVRNQAGQFLAEIQPAQFHGLNRGRRTFKNRGHFLLGNANGRAENG